MADNGKRQQNDGNMRIDPAMVQELARLLDANGLTEIEVEDGDRKIKVCRNPAPILAAGSAHAAAQPQTATAASQGVAQPAEPVSQSESAPADGEMVKSPMVGTAFMSAEPGAKPFVSVGDTVKMGDTLLIVEAMKVMNPITAPTAGVVKKILVSDAQPIEFDQPLLIIG